MVRHRNHGQRDRRAKQQFTSAPLPDPDNSTYTDAAESLDAGAAVAGNLPELSSTAADSSALDSPSDQSLLAHTGGSVATIGEEVGGDIPQDSTDEISTPALCVLEAEATDCGIEGDNAPGELEDSAERDTDASGATDCGVGRENSLDKHYNSSVSPQQLAVVSLHAKDVGQKNLFVPTTSAAGQEFQDSFPMGNTFGSSYQTFTQSSQGYLPSQMPSPSAWNSHYYNNGAQPQTSLDSLFYPGQSENEIEARAHLMARQSRNVSVVFSLTVRMEALTFCRCMEYITHTLLDSCRRNKG